VGEQSTDDVLQTYYAFGSKRSGGEGDVATGVWLETRLRELGYTTERQPFSAPFHDTRTANLRAGDVDLDVVPQSPFVATPSVGVEGPLIRWPGRGTAAGALAVVVLPFRRWSSFQAPEVRGPVMSALEGGAAGVIVVTTGPTGEALALNAPVDAAPFPAPVVILAPRIARSLVALLDTGAAARLTVTGATGRREAWNLIGRLNRGAGRWLAISTPRSGWFACAAERGPGVAAWLALAEWARLAAPDLDIALVCTSGHEFDNAGGHRFLRSGAPPPDRTALWVHLGANLAARDWRDLGPKPQPLPSADPQRFLMVDPGLLAAAAESFAGQPGLEAPQSTGGRAEGELKEILSAGYPTVAGVFGAHRFHHAAGDDMRCVSAGLVNTAIEGFKRLIGTALAC
jgi:hypothetical protein